MLESTRCPRACSHTPLRPSHQAQRCTGTRRVSQRREMHGWQERCRHPEYETVRKLTTETMDTYLFKLPKIECILNLAYRVQRSWEPSWLALSASRSHSRGPSSRNLQVVSSRHKKKRWCDREFRKSYPLSHSAKFQTASETITFRLGIKAAHEHVISNFSLL